MGEGLTSPNHTAHPPRTKRWAHFPSFPLEWGTPLKRCTPISPTAHRAGRRGWESLLASETSPQLRMASLETTGQSPSPYVPPARMIEVRQIDKPNARPVTFNAPPGLRTCSDLRKLISSYDRARALAARPYTRATTPRGKCFFFNSFKIPSYFATLAFILAFFSFPSYLLDIAIKKNSSNSGFKLY